MGTLNFIEKKITECVICKSKNWKPIQSSVDANEYACYECSINYYFLFSDSELEKVRLLIPLAMEIVKSNLGDKTIFEKRMEEKKNIYPILSSRRYPITYADLENIFNNRRNT